MRWENSGIPPKAHKSDSFRAGVGAKSKCGSRAATPSPSPTLAAPPEGLRHRPSPPRPALTPPEPNSSHRPDFPPPSPTPVLPARPSAPGPPHTNRRCPPSKARTTWVAPEPSWTRKHAHRASHGQRTRPAATATKRSHRSPGPAPSPHGRKPEAPATPRPPRSQPHPGPGDSAHGRFSPRPRAEAPKPTTGGEEAPRARRCRYPGGPRAHRTRGPSTAPVA
uniref:vegetative cell wall protein gp1-like n=1 Tax=Odobenus rosmarus divergens TaxID=9708 RepID=UPI00063CD463|nr:PREDICTED: vegetative cell wall protein gp1-like [Odobenus rosmarus divergens]